MIIQKCDICNREVLALDTMILYKRPIDYCYKCKEEVEKMKQEYKREIEYENVMLDSRLKSKEKNIISKVKQKYDKGIVVKE